MKGSTIALGFVTLLATAGCMPVMNQGYPVGIFYTGTRAPSLLNRVEAGGANKASTKSGRACSTGIIGVAAFGDASIDAAKKQGGISTVNSVEYDATSYVLGIYVEACTIVHGT